MYHSFFILSSVDRHLGCLHVLLIVNSAAVKTGVHVSRYFSLFPLMSLSNGWSVLFIFLKNQLLVFFFLSFLLSPSFLF